MISKIRSWFRKPQEKLPFNPKVKANFVVEPRGKEASIRRHVEDAAKILQNEGFKSIKTTSFGTEVAGNLNQAHNIINIGFKIGVGGILTFKNSNIKNVISQIEIKHLILETDSPYLSPEPLRGKVNEPANIIFISEKLSEILSVPIEIVSQVTSENVKNLFDLQSN